MISKVTLADIDYHLPVEKIAFFPLDKRDQSKLLVYQNNAITDANFSELPDFLDENYALIFNDSKVIHARLLIQNRFRATIEIFLLEPVYPTHNFASAFSHTGVVAWKCLIGNAKRFREPITFSVKSRDFKEVSITVEKGDKVGDAFLVTFMWEDESVSLAEWVEAYGKMPLPPYIKREATAADEESYQTIYAQQQGSVAAPTAGLHFTEEVLQSLKNKNISYQKITLHVGAGTFKPITTDSIMEHEMHAEQIVISRETVDFLIKNIEKKIVAVGTTVARTIESLFIMGAKLHLNIATPLKVTQYEIYENPALQKVSVADALAALSYYFRTHHLSDINATTSLMILPHYQHKIAKGLVTNFHQPKSTLLLLISSYLGEEWKTVYNHALTNNYRFLSYGDSNLYL